jgi:hypothetical protein
LWQKTGAFINALKNGDKPEVTVVVEQVVSTHSVDEPSAEEMALIDNDNAIATGRAKDKYYGSLGWLVIENNNHTAPWRQFLTLLMEGNRWRAMPAVTDMSYLWFYKGGCVPTVSQSDALALSQDMCFFLQDDPKRLDFSLPNTAKLTLLYQIIKTLQDKGFQTILLVFTRISVSNSIVSVSCHLAPGVSHAISTPQCTKSFRQSAPSELLDRNFLDFFEFHKSSNCWSTLDIPSSESLDLQMFTVGLLNSKSLWSS